jgi:hypothetical protein
MVEAFYSNGFMFNAPGIQQIRNPPKSDSYTWRASRTGSRFAQASTEGASAPTYNIASVIKLEVAYTRYDVSGSVTTEAIAEARSADPVAIVLDQMRKDLLDKISVTELAVVEAAMDNSSTYAGQTRSSYTDVISSGEDSTSEALSISDIETGVRTLLDADLGARYEDMIMYASPTLCQKYAAIANKPFDANRVITRAQGAGADGGYGKITMLEHNGIPIVMAPDLTSTTWLITVTNNVKMVELMPLKLSALAKVNGADNYLLEWMGKAIVERPSLAYKLTSKT